VRPSDAAMLAAKLQAAFPFLTPPQATIELYAEELAKLDNVEAARVAVDALIYEATFWPPLATLHERYTEARRRIAERQAAERGLAERAEEPTLDELENRRRARALLDRLNRAQDERNRRMPAGDDSEAEA
jgi:hypothetical protein